MAAWLRVAGTATHPDVEGNLIEQVRPGTVAIMRAGLEEKFTNPESADLIAFLTSTRRRLTRIG